MILRWPRFVLFFGFNTKYFEDYCSILDSVTKKELFSVKGLRNTNTIKMCKILSLNCLLVSRSFHILSL